MNRDRGRVAYSPVAVVAALAVLASVLVVFPAAVAQTTATAPLAWGLNDHGQLGPNGPKPSTANPVEVPGLVGVPGLADVKQLSAGLGHTLARRDDGTVSAWGRNSENQLGDGASLYYHHFKGCLNCGGREPSPDRPRPGQVSQRTEDPVPSGESGSTFETMYTIGPIEPLTDVKAVAAGGYHSLAVKNDGTVWAWGDNRCGQLGNGKNQLAEADFPLIQGTDSSPPAAVKVPGLANVESVAAGRGHSLALDKNGVLWAWGDNRWGQGGDGTSRPPEQPLLFAAPLHPCNMPDDGPDGHGRGVPARVQLPSRVVAFAAGSDHSLAVTVDGTVWSWGNNCSGQLGSGPDAEITAFRAVPAPVSGLPGQVVALAAGGPALGGHSVALTSTGRLLAWGLADVLGGGNGSSPLVSPCMSDPAMAAFVADGNDPVVQELRSQDGRLAPAPVVDTDSRELSDMAALDAGVFHSLAVDGDGNVFAWGRNNVGQLGPKAPLEQTAIEVSLDPTIAGVSAGSHSLALPGSEPPRPTPTTLLPEVTTTTTAPTTTTTAPTTTTTAPTTTTTAPTTTTTAPPPPPRRDRVILWQWVNPLVSTVDPGELRESAMAYDVQGGRTILFGGLTTAGGGYTVRGDTYTWDGNFWVKTGVPGPDKRHGHAMAYDAERQQVVLFGGLGGLDSNQLPLGDTWAWSAGKWTKITSEGPSARAFMSMAYDAERKQVVLFGGEGADGVPLRDTWAWNGEGWTELKLDQATGPPPRSRSAMAYDPSAKKALLYGGWNGSGALNDTWTWDGGTWSRVNTGPYPERRWGHAMAYHRLTGQIVLVGGSEEPPDSGDECDDCEPTWTWNGTNWGTALVEPEPLGRPDLPLGGGIRLAGERTSAAMAEDRLGRLALYGGLVGGGETEETHLFVVPAPGAIPIPPPPPEVCATRESTAPAQNTTTTTAPQSTTTTPQSTTTAPAPSTTTTPASSTTTTTQPPGTTVQSSTWKQETSPAAPSAREGAAMAYDPTKKETIFFGGFNRNADPKCVLDDTWVWDGTTWTRKEPTNKPDARYGHTMAYDAEGHVVLFGGSDGVDDLDDTWVWDGDNWEQRHVPGPSLRARHAMASGRHGGERVQVVLFGGDHLGVALGDTWVWDGFTWAERHPATTPPPPRGYAAMAYDAARKNTVLAGGFNAATRNTDGDATVTGTWLWDGSNWRDMNDRFSLRASPKAHSAVMAFDPSSQKVVLRWGAQYADPGEGPDRAPDGTVAWDGTSWSHVDGANYTSSQNEGDPVLPARTFAAMAEDESGGLVFFGGYGQEAGPRSDRSVFPDGGGDVPYLRPGDADRGDTWTYRAPAGHVTVPVDPSDDPVYIPPYGVKVTLDPAVINANGDAKAEATATVTRDGEPDPGRAVSFTTDGDVTFSPVVDKGDGTYITTITASRTAGIETITAINEHPVYGTGSAQLTERGIRVKLEPSSLQPDKKSTSRATATLFPGGPLPDQDVQFRTDGNVTFSAVERQPEERVWAVTITASDTPGPETITATASPSGLSGSAVLTEGADGWYDKSHPVSAPSPDARDQSAMAFDGEGTVLFGGFDGDRSDPFGDTWVWDGSAWAPRLGLDPSPPARYGHAMAYDAARDLVVLFGGYGRFGYLDDTWTWNGTKWTEEHPTDSPSARYGPAMAYDEARAQVVLFGGWTAKDCNLNLDPAQCPVLGDTWTWDGAGWTERLTTAPPSTPPTAKVQDFHNPKPIVVPLPPPPAGCPGSNCPPATADLYPSPITVSGMTDTVSKVTVVLKDLSWPNGVVENDGNGPSDADIMLVAPDGRRSVMLMSDACGNDDSPNPIGRNDEEEITLTFDDGAPGMLSADGPCAEGPPYRPTNVSTAEETEWHSPDAFPAPAPRRADGDSLGHFRGIEPNGTWRLYVVDDGPNTPNPLGESGRIEGGWTLWITTTKDAVVAPVPVTPPARGWATMAYHRPTGKVVLYGGSEVYVRCRNSQTDIPNTCGAPFHPMADTWTWDGAKWAQEGSGANPGLRHSASMAFDAGSGQLVLFGGSDGRAGDVPERDLDQEGRNDRSRDDTWTWDGEVWAPHTSLASTPPRRLSAAMAQGPSDTIVMFSGLHDKRTPLTTDFSYLDDTWVYERRMTVSLEPGVLPADEESTTTAVARVVDTAGGGISGLTVTFTTDGDATFSKTVDHLDGTYSATITASGTDGLETITAATPFSSAATTLNEVRAVACSERTKKQAGTWETVTRMPEPRAHMAVASGRDGRIYTFGGDTDASTAESYDPCTNTWQTLPVMPGGGRTWATASVAPDGRIYVAGGYIFNNRKVEVYTPGIGTTPGRWETAPSMPTDRHAMSSAVADDGRLYLMAGVAYGAPPPCGSTRAADVYTPAADGAPGKWDSFTDLSMPRFGPSAATSPDGRILVAGGADASCEGFNSVEALDPGSDTWETAAPMSAPRVFSAAAVGDGRVYVTGGSRTAAIYSEGVNPGTTNTVDSYSPCAQAWLPVAPMPRSRDYHDAARGGDGRIYVLGGRADPEVGERDTIPDPSTESPLVLARKDITDAVDAYTPDPSTDPCPEVSINDVTVAEPSSGTTPARFTVTLDRPAVREVQVAYQTYDGTATHPSDYTERWGTVEFAPGDITQTVDGPPATVPATTSPGTTVPDGLSLVLPVVDPSSPPTTVPDPSQTPISQTIDVPVRWDEIAEGSHKFTVELTLLTPATATMADAIGVGTITEAVPVVSVEDAGTVTEGKEAVFKVILDKASLTAVQVDYHTENGPLFIGATPDDYTATSAPTRLVIPAGAKEAEVKVPVADDDVPERPEGEDFFLRLTNPTGATLGRDRATATIIDPPFQPPLPVASVTGPSAKVPEPADGATATAMFKVTLSPAPREAVKVPYTTDDGSASATEGDYAFSSDTLEFAAGQPSQDVAVTVRGDADEGEGDENFFLQLGAPDRATLGPDSRAMATIVDPPFTAKSTVSVSGPGAAVPEPGLGSPVPSPATFMISLSGETDHDVTVSYRTVAVPDEATEDSDYTGKTGAVKIPAKGTNEPVTVSVLADADSPEPLEDFTLEISVDPKEATLAGGPATATILNTPPGPPVYTYACAVSSPTATGAILGATTTDPGVRAATFTLRQGAAVVRTIPDGEAPFSTTVQDLAPGTDYVLSVVFEPGGHAQTNQPCTFRTLAGQNSTTTTSTTSTSTTSTTVATTTTTPAPTTTAPVPTTTALPPTTTPTTTAPPTTTTANPGPTTTTTAQSFGASGDPAPQAPPPATPPPASPPPAAPTPPAQAPQGMAQAQPGPQAQSQPGGATQVQTAAQSQAAAQAQAQAAAQAQAGAQGQGQSQGQSQQQGQRQGQQQAEAQGQPGGAMGDREKEAEAQVETESSDGSKGSTYLSSSVRKETIPAPALAWATTAVVAAALGMAAGLRRRGGAAASVVRIGPSSRSPGQRRRSAQRRRR